MCTMRSLRMWNSLGFRVLRGARSYRRSCNGTPLFSRNQVVKKHCCCCQRQRCCDSY